MEPAAFRRIGLKSRKKKAGLAARLRLSCPSRPVAAASRRNGQERGPPAYFIVGMANSAPSLTPVGQREVIVLVLV